MGIEFQYILYIFQGTQTNIYLNTCIVQIYYIFLVRSLSTAVYDVLHIAHIHRQQLFYFIQFPESKKSFHAQVHFYLVLSCKFMGVCFLPFCATCSQCIFCFTYELCINYAEIILFYQFSVQVIIFILQCAIICEGCSSRTICIVQGLHFFWCLNVYIFDCGVGISDINQILDQIETLISDFLQIFCSKAMILSKYVL
eukprot:TRINITY_DN8354_c0_g1_i2.p1 TRINITY_DN8354_c0_g1~~TRINITY_DN8354_c0_g1_i2.p1  ORF type:complete len:198 (-),score=-24.03 TRINITY_DN8354_c0_g1_i2:60-653(-)